MTHLLSGAGSSSSSSSAAVGFAAWGNGTDVAVGIGGRVEYKFTPTTISFAAAPAVASDCWTVHDMFGQKLAADRVCATAGGIVSVLLPANGSATGPIYLLPTAHQGD